MRKQISHSEGICNLVDISNVFLGNVGSSIYRIELCSATISLRGVYALRYYLCLSPKHFVMIGQHGCIKNSTQWMRIYAVIIWVEKKHQLLDFLRTICALNNLSPGVNSVFSWPITCHYHLYFLPFKKSFHFFPWNLPVSLPYIYVIIYFPSPFFFFHCLISANSITNFPLISMHLFLFLW